MRWMLCNNVAYSLLLWYRLLIFMMMLEPPFFCCSCIHYQVLTQAHEGNLASRISAREALKSYWVSSSLGRTIWSLYVSLRATILFTSILLPHMALTAALSRKTFDLIYTSYMPVIVELPGPNLHSWSRKILWVPRWRCRSRVCLKAFSQEVHLWGLLCILTCLLERDELLTRTREPLSHL